MFSGIFAAFPFFGGASRSVAASKLPPVPPPIPEFSCTDELQPVMGSATTESDIERYMNIIAKTEASVLKRKLVSRSSIPQFIRDQIVDSGGRDHFYVMENNYTMLHSVSPRMKRFFTYRKTEENALDAFYAPARERIPYTFYKLWKHKVDGEDI